MIIDPFQVISIISKIAEEEIIPKFLNLKPNEVFKKSNGEIVTIADIKAEQRLDKALSSLILGSKTIGEEKAAQDTSILKYLNENKPVWIIDPIDGTQNFSNGTPCFAVMVALVLNKEIIASWIHDPITKITIHAYYNKGAWDDTKRLKIKPPAPLNKMIGSFPKKLVQQLEESKKSNQKFKPNFIKRYRCVGREYMDLARGKLNFLRYSGQLKPWDHAPGILINRELGGYDSLVPGNAPYVCSEEIPRKTLMLARDANIWRKLSKLAND
jgi:fructose-1,6-bisphosphatase/inositol monophosphatase family enzyme